MAGADAMQAGPGAAAPRLVGQAQAERLLARAVVSGRVAHAYLFLGPVSSGKSTAARLFAQAVNCARQPAAARPQDRDGWRLAPCGACESCRRILADTHPEVLEVIPQSKTGQNITVEQSREIRRNAALRPKLGARRVYFIPHAEAFNEESANALLKTLEEPSETVILILCAPSPSQVLPTIRSRCQTIRFGLAPPAELSEALRAAGTDPETAGALARASGGRPGLAFQWARDPAVLDRRRRVLDVFVSALRARPAAAGDPAGGVYAFRLAEELLALAGKDDEDGPARPAKALHRDNLEVGLGLLRDLLLLADGAEPEVVQNQDRLTQLRELAGHQEIGRLLGDVRAVQEAQQILDRNVAPQLALERMFWALLRGPVPLPARLFSEERP